MKTWCRDNWSAIDLIHMARYTRDRMLVCYTCNTNRIVVYMWRMYQQLWSGPGDMDPPVRHGVLADLISSLCI